MPHLAMLKNPFKNSWIWIQKSIASKINQFFLVRSYISGKIFIKIRRIVFTPSC